MEQGAIPLRPHGEIRFVEEAVISRIPSELEAIKQSVRESGKSDNLVASECGIDPAQLSRIMSKSAHFPTDKRGLFYRSCGNYILLQYLNYSEGFESHPRKRKSELELALDDAMRQLEEERLKNRVLTEAIGGAR